MNSPALWWQNISWWPSGVSAPPPSSLPVSELKSKLSLKCFLIKKNMLSVSPQHFTLGRSTLGPLQHYYCTTVLLFTLWLDVCATLGFCGQFWLSLLWPAPAVHTDEQINLVASILCFLTCSFQQEITPLMCLFSIHSLDDWQSQGTVVTVWIIWLRVSDISWGCEDRMGALQSKRKHL